MGKPRAPKPPDPRETAAAQMGTNVATALTNTLSGNVNQIGPQGSMTYDQTGTHEFTDPFTGQSYDIPTFTARTQLTPQQQRIFDTQQQAQQTMMNTADQQAGRLQSHLRQDFSPANLPDFGSIPNAPRLNDRFARGGDITRTYGADDFSVDRQRVEDALMERMQPQIDRDRASMDTQLANQGIGMGSRAFSAAQQDFGQNVNDARLGAILSAGQEQSRLVGMDRDRALFQNQAQQQAFGQDATNLQMQNAARHQGFGMDMQRMAAKDQQRQQALQEQIAMRNQPINEISALMSGSQVSLPQFGMNQPQPIPFTDNAGLINNQYQQQMGNYNAQMGAWNETMGGLLGFGAGVLSDERSKTDIRRVGTTDGGLPIYTYRYKQGGPVQMGVIAQDVAQVQPDAVVPMGDMLGVDYGKVA